MNKEEEQWLPYPGFAGFYEVSTLGNVYSLPRTTTPGGLLTPIISTYGYRTFVLSKYGRTYYRRGARMTLETFVGPCPPGEEACHGPNGQSDDGLHNVSWGTREKNQGEDRVRDGTSNRGARCGASELTAEIVIECHQRYLTGETQRALAEEFNVDQAAISKAIRGKTWAELNLPPIPVNTKPGAKLTEAIVIECRRRYASGETQATLAAEFGVTHSTISHAIHGRRWAHLDGAIDLEEDGRSRPQAPELEAKREEWGRKGAEIRWGKRSLRFSGVVDDRKVTAVRAMLWPGVHIRMHAPDMQGDIRYQHLIPAEQARHHGWVISLR